MAQFGGKGGGVVYNTGPEVGADCIDKLVHMQLFSFNVGGYFPFFNGVHSFAGLPIYGQEVAFVVTTFNHYKHIVPALINDDLKGCGM